MLANLLKEVKYKTSKSSGSGGQHVNKVSTRAKLLFDVKASNILTDDQKRVLLAKLKNRISAKGILSLSCEKNA